MITSITNPGTSTYALFEVNFIAGWAHCQKNQHPELNTRVQDFIAQSCGQSNSSSAPDNANIQSMNWVESLEMRAFARSGQRLLYQWMRLTGLQRILVISSLHMYEKFIEYDVKGGGLIC